MLRLSLLKKPFRRFPLGYHLLFGWHRSTRFLDPFERTQSVFIHVPKAAGTSIAMALYGRQIPHYTWRKWHEINPKKFRDYFKFAVVRNPIYRFTSSFYFLKMGGMNEGDENFRTTILKPFVDPNEFAEALIDPDLQARVLKWWHFRPQTEFVADEFGRSKMDFLIRFENIGAGFDFVSRKLNGESRKLPHLNKTRTLPDVEMTRESRDVLECLYRKDFILWEKYTS